MKLHVWDCACSKNLAFQVFIEADSSRRIHWGGLSVFYNFVCVVFIAVTVLSHICVLMSPFHLSNVARSLFQGHDTCQKYQGPCCDSDIEPDQYNSFVWESHVCQQILSSLKIFIVNRNIFQLVSITYILKIINVCKTMLNVEKTVQMSDFHSYAVLLLWVKLCYGIYILLRNVWRAGLQSCS